MSQYSHHNSTSNPNSAIGQLSFKSRRRCVRRASGVLGKGAIALALTSLPTSCGSDESPTRATAARTTTAVRINELQSKNSTLVCTETGKKSDWVELYNPGDSEENLEGFFISDDKKAPEKSVLPAEAVVPAGGFLVLWLDDTADPGTPLHFPFKLSGDGESFYLNAPNGRVIHAVAVPADPTGDNPALPDVSYGAYPDGSDDFGWCSTPTLGKKNSGNCVGDAGD